VLCPDLSNDSRYNVPSFSSFTTTQQFAQRPPYLQHSQLLYSVMASSVSSGLSPCIQVKWSIGWCVACMSSRLNHVKAQSSLRICLLFPFFKVSESTHRCLSMTDIWVPALHFDTAANHKRMRLFWTAFVVMFIYEILPSYIFPLLNGFSIFCLASQRASPSLQDIFTNIFGGADGNEGLGLFSLSFDWQYIGSGSVSCTCDISVCLDISPSTDT